MQKKLKEFIIIVNDYVIEKSIQVGEKIEYTSRRKK